MSDYHKYQNSVLDASGESNSSRDKKWWMGPFPAVVLEPWNSK